MKVQIEISRPFWCPYRMEFCDIHICKLLGDKHIIICSDEHNFPEECPLKEMVLGDSK